MGGDDAPDGAPRYQYCEVRCLLDARAADAGEEEILVQWGRFGGPPADDLESTWELRSRLLADCPELVRMFDEEQDRKERESRYR